MKLTKSIKEAAKRLWEANEQKETCPPVRELIGTEDIEKAYAVQKINNDKRAKKGARLLGCKIGLTSIAVQKQLGVDQPDFGLLYNDMEVFNGGEISVKELMQAKVEAEIAFVLGKDLKGKQLGAADIISAVDYALASIEIVGSRVENWNIRLNDTIADNASASHFVLGHLPKKLSEIDLVNCKMVMKNGRKKVSSGTGADCMGSPINACVWLANKMAALGQPLKAGDLILTGALGPMTAVKAGDHFTASIEGLGDVSVAFTK